jgi:hypothetical protein
MVVQGEVGNAEGRRAWPKARLESVSAIQAVLALGSLGGVAGLLARVLDVGAFGGQGHGEPALA